MMHATIYTSTPTSVGRILAPSCYTASTQGFFVLEDRIGVYWGHVSQIRVEYLLFEYARQRGGYSYYHLLSGGDMPLKSQEQIHSFFTQHAGQDFVEYDLAEGQCADARFKTDRYHPLTKYERNSYPPLVHRILWKLRIALYLGINALLPRRSFAGECVKGSNWVSLTESTVDFILQHKQAILKRYRWTTCGDEIFLQSLLYNEASQRTKLYSLETGEGHKRFLIFPYGAKGPLTLTGEHADAVLSSDALFARKFDSTASAELLAQLLPRLRPQD